MTWRPNSAGPGGAASDQHPGYDAAPPRRARFTTPAYLTAREERWRHRLAGLLEAAGDDPLERILAYVHGYARIPETDVGGGFRGCALVNAAAELAGDDDPSLAVVRGSLATVRRGLEQILLDAAVEETEAKRLAGHVLIVLEGAVAVGGIYRDEQRALDALDLVRDVVAPALRPAGG